MDLLVGEAIDDTTPLVRLRVFLKQPDGSIKNIGNVQANGVDIIYPTRHSKGGYIDFNGDGIKDLFVTLRYGDVRVYPNIGSASEPEFSNFIDLEAGGEPIKGNLACLDFADINSDGLFDLVLGIGSKENIANFNFLKYSLNVGTLEKPKFSAMVPVKMSNGEPFSYSVGSPGYKLFYISVCDWNGDNHPDILSMIYAKGAAVFLNKGDGTFLEPFAAERPKKQQNFKIRFNNRIIPLETDNQEVKQISLYSLSGKRLFNKILPGYNISINDNSLSSQKFILSVECEKETYQVIVDK